MRNVFVFGSNLGGFHGAGSAKAAMDDHGAIYGLGVGPAGNSYAIPTKDSNIEVLDLDIIELHVAQFLDYAEYIYFAEQALCIDEQDEKHSEGPTQFNIVDIGCGLSGYTAAQIAPMFVGAPDNCVFLGKFKAIVEELREKAILETETGE